jgi:hypothetical protein
VPRPDRPGFGPQLLRARPKPGPKAAKSGQKWPSSLPNNFRRTDFIPILDRLWTGFQVYRPQTGPISVSFGPKIPARAQNVVPKGAKRCQMTFPFKTPPSEVRYRIVVKYFESTLGLPRRRSGSVRGKSGPPPPSRANGSSTAKTGGCTPCHLNSFPSRLGAVPKYFLPEWCREFSIANLSPLL